MSAPLCHTRSAELMDQARQYMPGGVSSDIRLAGAGLVFTRGDGAYIYDVDGNRYIDYVMGMGPLILGHTPPSVVAAVQEQAARGLIYGGQNEYELRVATLIAAAVPCAESMRFNCVGSEVTHAATRLARGFTGRQMILKFEGHYHGWLDGLLHSTAVVPEQAGPRERPNTVPMTGGMAASAAADVVVAPWNDLSALAAIMEAYKGQIAGVIMEPVMCNTGCIDPVPGYLAGVQKLCREHGTLLIFDEVITGFRTDLGGAQKLYGVTPDLATFGKAVAAGLPLSVIAGRAEIMELITSRKVMHAGTFNSNPLVMAGAAAALALLSEDDGAVYRIVRTRGAELAAGIRALASRYGVPVTVSGPGPMLQVLFSAPEAVRDARDVAASDIGARDRFVGRMLEQGVRITSRGLLFLSSCHGGDELGATLAAVQEVFRTWWPAQGRGFRPFAARWSAT